MNPAYSANKACEQAVLLEGHLVDPAQRCPDCIRKHFQAMAGYLEESLRLGAPEPFRSYIQEALPHVRWAGRYWGEGMDPEIVAHAIRDVRKFIADWCFNQGF